MVQVHINFMQLKRNLCEIVIKQVFHCYWSSFKESPFGQIWKGLWSLITQGIPGVIYVWYRKHIVYSWISYFKCSHLEDSDNTIPNEKQLSKDPLHRHVPETASDLQHLPPYYAGSSLNLTLCFACAFLIFQCHLVYMNTCWKNNIEVTTSPCFL